MLCKIADLLAEVPEAGGMAPRCRDYLWEGKDCADVIIRTEHYRPEKYPHMNENDMAYMESARIFYRELINYNGFYLHASAVEVDGKAFLFSGHCGAGKSTHTRLWKKRFGDCAYIINDDKPALRYLDGKWYAYGTPWCGKDGININRKAPLAGICYLVQAQENRIRRLTKEEAFSRVFRQTIHKFADVQRLDILLMHINSLLDKIPVFELENRPEPEAALLSYETMRHAAEEMGL